MAGAVKYKLVRVDHDKIKFCSHAYRCICSNRCIVHMLRKINGSSFCGSEETGGLMVNLLVLRSIRYLCNYVLVIYFPTS